MSQADIKQHIDRARKAIVRKPAIAQGEKSATTRLVDGLTCVTEEGPWTLHSDMPQVIGGSESSPNPGTYCRAALGSCLATGYSIWAAQLGITINSLEVSITTTFDDGGLLGANEDPPGYSRVVYRVSIDSDASREDIIKLLDTADKHSPLLDVFTRNLNCIREVDINP